MPEPTSPNPRPHGGSGAAEVLAEQPTVEKTKVKNLPYCLATAGPGPATYKLPSCLGFVDHDPSRWRGPAFTVRGRGAQGGRQLEDGPGPCHSVAHCTRFGLITTPSVKFQKGGNPGAIKKIEPPRKVLGFQEQKRAPLQHEMKGFTIAGRHYLTSKKLTPGPNHYKMPDSLGFNVPDLKRAPAFSLQSRPYMRQVHRAPGPAEYESINCNYYKTQAPRAIIPSKKSSAKMASNTPGPTAYMVNYNLQLPRAPTFAFGTKHSICTGTMLTPADDSLNRT